MYKTLRSYAGMTQLWLINQVTLTIIPGCPDQLERAERLIIIIVLSGRNLL